VQAEPLYLYASTELPRASLLVLGPVSPRQRQGLLDVFPALSAVIGDKGVPLGFCAHVRPYVDVVELTVSEYLTVAEHRAPPEIDLAPARAVLAHAGLVREHRP
jgi:hypothetical protein